MTATASSNIRTSKYRVWLPILTLICSFALAQFDLIGSAASSIPIVKDDLPQKQEYPDTTIVITSSLIPSHPSIGIISDAIKSVHERLKGLHPDTPFIIAIDGLKPSATDDDRQRYAEMVDNLHTNYTSALVLTKNVSEGLTKNIKRSIDYVQTKYLYLVQHDLMFALDINHTAMVKTFDEYHPSGLMNVVRFNLRKNMFRFSDRRYPCFGMNSPMNRVNGIYFTKTGHWSDNNQFSSKQYYLDLFRIHFHSEHMLSAPMEYRMTHVTAANCSFEGPWLYGRKRSGPWLIHLDGKRTAAYFGNMTNMTVSGHF